MRRLFWLAVGAGVTGLAVRRANKIANAVSKDGLTGRVAGVGAAIGEFADEVRAGMAERELELRDALGLDGAAQGENTGVKRGM